MDCTMTHAHNGVFRCHAIDVGLRLVPLQLPIPMVSPMIRLEQNAWLALNPYHTHTPATLLPILPSACFFSLGASRAHGFCPFLQQ
jgi:hypothetical protein